MAQAFSLQPLLELMQTRTDEATRKLGHLIAAEQSAKSRLQMLEQYRTDYANQLRTVAERGLTRSTLKNYQDFLARIDEAITQQAQTVKQSEKSTAAGQEDWQNQNKRMKAIDTLSQRHEARERLREVKREQKIQDEFSARKYAVRSTKDID